LIVSKAVEHRIWQSSAGPSARSFSALSLNKASARMVRTGQQGVISTVGIRNFDRENSWCRVVVATVCCKDQLYKGTCVCGHNVVLLQVAVGSDRAAGKIEAYLVNRPGLLQDCKAYFHYFMYKPTQVLCDLALGVFDRHGHLKPHLYGTFGPETNDGGLLYIRTVTLKQQYRCKGIGRSAVGQLLRQLNSTYRERASWGLAGTRTLLPCLQAAECGSHIPANPPVLVICIALFGVQKSNSTQRC